MLVTVLGFAVYGTASVTSLQLFGIALNTAGGCWYTAIEYRDKSARAAAAGSAGGGAAGAADAAAAAAAAAAVAAEEAASPRPAAAASEQQQQHGGLASPRDELIVGPMSPSRVADHLRHRAGP